MEAVIDPDTLTCMGFVQSGTVLYNSWASCVLVPVDDNFVNQPLKVEKDGDDYVLSVDDQAKLDKAWTALRSERNRRLAETDWVALADAHLSQDKKDAWFAYRQKLRDFPEEVTVTSLQDFDTLTWPIKPDVEITPVIIEG
jgi:hypothetical protein